MDELLTAREAMAVLNCGRTFLTEHKAELGATYVGARLRFSRAELDAYLARNRVAGAAPVVRDVTPVRPTTHTLPAGRNMVTGLPFGATMPARSWSMTTRPGDGGGYGAPDPQHPPSARKR